MTQSRVVHSSADCDPVSCPECDSPDVTTVRVDYRIEHGEVPEGISAVLPVRCCSKCRVRLPGAEFKLGGTEPGGY